MARRTATDGLGWSHQMARAALPPPNGEPCPFCQKPMWPSQRLHADHAVPRVLGGHGSPLRWAHGACNESAGATLKSLLRQHKANAPDRWLDRWA